MPDNAVDYTKDVCDFCERVIDASAKHVCATMPIDRVIDPENTWSASYEDLVACFGRIVVEVSDSDYQGDTRYLLHAPDGRWGILVNGWGSCSGCDALQACGDAGDFAKLRESLSSNVKWFDTADACRAYIQGKDWETEFYHREPQTGQFVEQCLAALGSRRVGEP